MINLDRLVLCLFHNLDKFFDFAIILCHIYDTIAVSQIKIVSVKTFAVAYVDSAGVCVVLGLVYLFTNKFSRLIIHSSENGLP